MSKPIHVALIGFGRIGQMHYQKLQALENVFVQYVVDANAQGYHATQGFGETQFTTSDKLMTVLADDLLDAVVIATPTDTHCELVTHAARAGLAIFCEKPVSLNLQALENVERELEKNPVYFQVGLNRRFDPDFEQVAAQLRQKQYGQVYSYSIVNRDPQLPKLKFAQSSGGLFHDFNIHDFDLLQFLSQAKITSVKVLADALVSDALKQANDQDTALIQITLSDGCIALIDCSRETQFGYDQRLEILTELGLVQVDNHPTHLVQQIKNQSVSTASPKWSFVERYAQSYEAQFDAFISAIRTPECQEHRRAASIHDIKAAIRVADAAQQSAKTGQCVKVC